MDELTIYELVEMIKDAREDAKVLRGIRAKKEADLELLQGGPKWKVFEKQDEIKKAISSLYEVEKVQWGIVDAIQTEINKRNS